MLYLGMVQTNKVDDYYANLSSSPKEDDTKTTKKKVVKKKIVVKKAKPKLAQSAGDDAKKRTTRAKTKKTTTTAEGKETKPKSKKKIVQKIKVVTREERAEADKNKPKTTVKKRAKKTFEPPKAEDNRSSKTTKPKSYKKSTIGVAKKKSFDNEEGKKKGFKKRGARTRGKVRFEEDNTFTRSKAQKQKKKQEKKVEDIVQNLTDRKGETVVVSDFTPLKELSEKIGVALPKIIAEFMKNGMMVNINSKIDFESASIIAEAFEVKLKRDDSAGASVEDIFIGDISSFLAEDNQEDMLPRPPVISIMGHVDHGKTSLLDYIRSAKVASGEAGGITQSIGAYQVELDSGKITFLDTPGHEAFTVMRARGAKSTDIAILVVAADEGVKPQTIESISHAKEANIPVIVAINKMDKEGANPDHVKGQLSEHGLVPEDWGGDTPMVPVSAHTGFGIDELLEMILLVSEMKELKANPNRNGIATVVESHLDSSLGPVATVLINTGTVNGGDNIVCGDSCGKIKILRNYKGEKIKFAKPGDPVLIVGLDKVVEGGDILQIVNSADIAKTKAIEYKLILEKQKRESASGLDLLMMKIKAGNLKQLKVILKADTNGSLEAIKGSLLKLSTPETTVTVIHSGVGSITEGDILMGQGSEAILVGFNVGVLTTAKGSLESSGVEFISSDIIYHITEKIEKIITGMLDPKEVEIVLGRAKVGGIFFTEKKFMIVGLNVQPENTIETKAKIRVFRKKKYIGAGEVDSLKQGTLDVKQVEGPTECGIKYVGNVKLEEKDELEFYKIEIQK
ncbi:translation initiation factor IF-2 [Candidatus Gracilibacteria bacterium]|nr:translation initiation factor IF-2 [Candidatus Gracilibacteria bacterium]